ncbi:F-box/RNI-like superfamily protein [Thalictrum thalictroides]|uniref:F-box/RNI-like superfamily protein n=1 Tax=Thalictrum thalictroides TaxID=46969 RepID=A0A7J6VXG1_THATH|nr:F-box/RNI-like superfamily protein [Thalictrum thalictroides]
MAAVIMNEDRISNLPDEIIHHILSFLDMKIVIQTCILSKRWRPLCTNLPCLNFVSKQTTWDFVEKTLLHQDPSSNIHAITLRLVLPYYWRTPLPLIQFAIPQGIRILDLQLDCYGLTIKVPHCLFTCQSLVNLKLRLVLHSYMELMFLYDPYQYKQHVVYVEPTTVKLPLLKTLHLESFCFHGNQFIQELLLGSPFLENISIINCGLHESHNLTISTTQLKYLEIDNIYACIGCCGSGIGLDRDQHFKNCKVEISAPMLTAFKCRAQISDQYLIHDFSSLATADIDMDFPKRCRYCVEKKFFSLGQLDEFGKNMMKFIQALYNATSLKLGTALLEVSIYNQMQPLDFLL